MTLFIILEQVLLHIPLLLGAYISIALMKVPDASIESAYVCGAMMGAKSMIALRGISFIVQVPLVFLASIVGGSLVGLTSSILTRKMGLPHLLSSIMTFGLFHGAIQALAAPYISLSGFTSQLMFLPFVSQHPELLCLLAIGIFLLVFFFYFFKTQLGYAYSVYGSNSSFFAQYGIATDYVFISGIALSNALAGLAGFLFAQSNGFAELTMGMGKLLLCITSLILGKVMVRSHASLNVAMPVVGVTTYFTLQQVLLKIGFNLNYFTMMQAGIVLVVLTLFYKRDLSNKRRVDHLGV